MPARKPKEPIKSVYVDIEKDLGYGFIMNTYLSRVAAVRFIDTDEKVNVSQGVKELYSKLASYGKSCGFNSIYDNQSTLAYDLGVTEKTIRNQLSILVKVGLVHVQAHKDKSQYTSNSYWLKRPNMISRVQWLDIKGDVLKGPNYNFNRKQFLKPLEDCKKDLLLAALLTYVKDNNRPDIIYSEVDTTKPAN